MSQGAVLWADLGVAAASTTVGRNELGGRNEHGDFTRFHGFFKGGGGNFVYMLWITSELAGGKLQGDISISPT